MRGCGCFLGGLLIPIAVIALLVIVVLPSVADVKDIPPLNNLLQSVFCERGETLDVQQHVSRWAGETSYSATYTCINEDEVERDVTGRATMIGILVFIVPFLLGLFTVIGTSISVANRAASSAIRDNVTSVFTITNPMRNHNFEGGSAKDSTTARLRDLKSAYDQGLITEAEYELKRKEILREM